MTIFGVNLKDFICYKTEVSSIKNENLNKYFSTKKAAEEYIELNKPKYSKADVIEALRIPEYYPGLKVALSSDVVKHLFGE